MKCALHAMSLEYRGGGGAELISDYFNAPIYLNVKMKIKSNVFFTSYNINQCLLILNPLKLDDQLYCTFLF